MGTYAYLYANENEIYSWRNSLDQSILAVFKKEDLISASGDDAKQLVKDRKLQAYDGYEEDEDFSVTLLCANKGHLLDRLKVIGLAEGGLKDLIDESYEYDKHFLTGKKDATMQEYYEKDVQLGKELVDAYPDFEPLSEEASKKLDDILENNPLSALYVYTKDLPSEDLITLDVSEMAYDGWYDDMYLEEVHTGEDYHHYDSPPIILTEGTSDIHAISKSIDLLYPHLKGFVKFLDTSFGTEGGTGALVKLIRSFAAAGISNRILAVFDNDTAAYDALSNLDVSTLPNNFKVMHYPRTELASNYPTLGPQGNALMDVNGLAGSIELYMGKDVLEGADGLYPVQWTGYMNKLKQYQGEVINKKHIQDSFFKKLKKNAKDPSSLKEEDWAEMRQLIAAIIDQLALY